MGHIFISYSRKDEEYVTKLVESLENEGFEVWIDRDLLTGDTWTQVINHKIDTCDAFVIVMTDESQKSNWVRREVLYAIQEGKKIFPLLLQGKLWMLLQDFNYFKVTNGLIPDRNFFNDMERFVPRSEAWLKTQREAVRKAEEFERQKAEKKKKKDREFVERKKKKKGLHDKQARDARAKEKFILEKKRREASNCKDKVRWSNCFLVRKFHCASFRNNIPVFIEKFSIYSTANT
ncbi:MAG: toll/interleukin-1 receptor domain-containing protein [Anaerolineales bacterium]|nr:toll/interleukin-1 receptor domain-containing protein [Anaerolineales bacterium]